MGLLNNLISKIFGGVSGPASAAPPASPKSGATPVVATASVGAPGAATPAPSAAPAVDISAVLDGFAAKNAEKLDWKRSIVDLMKLVGMDSSLSARKELAKELHFTGDTSDSATMNIWLHKAVLKRLAENGGKVPADLLD